MLKFPPTTPQDLKVAACIEQKRRNEEARKLRIFDPRCQIKVNFYLCLLLKKFSKVKNNGAYFCLFINIINLQ